MYAVCCVLGAVCYDFVLCCGCVVLCAGGCELCAMILMCSILYLTRLIGGIFGIEFCGLL